jgi:hypothetical protein
MAIKYKLIFGTLTMVVSIALTEILDLNAAYAWALGFAGGIVAEWLDRRK